VRDFFISYNNADRQWAAWIAWQLEDAGYTTILQAWDFRPGSNFALEMDRATRDAERTIAVLSDDYVSAVYTQPEWAEAFRKDPNGQERKLVPVRVGECKPEGLLGPIVLIDLVGSDQDAAREALLEGAKPGRAKPQSAPVFPAEVERSVQAPPTFPGVLPPVWNVPHLRNPNFTGRESLLTGIDDALAKGQHAALTQAVVGLGGVGKTQLALEYAYQYAGDYSVIWWVRSEEPAQLASDYAGLAAALDLREKEEPDQRVIVQAVRHWLEQNSGWLLIFDNAPNPDAVRDYLPRGGAGHLLITSLDPSWGAVASPLTVEEFEREESLDFLRKRTAQEEGAAELADALGDLPLALEQAAAYVEATGIALTDYLKLFQTRRRELWGKEKPPEAYSETVATTWTLAMDQVRRESRPAADLLNLCAYLAPDDIPLSLLRNGARHLPRRLRAAARDPVSLNDALAVLRRYSLVRVEGESLSLHRLVQAVTRDRLPEKDRRTWAAAATRLVNSAFPSESKDVRTWPVCARLLPHALAAAPHAADLDAAAEQSGRLFNQAGLYLHGRAEFSAAKAALERGLSLTEKAYGPDHPNLGSALSNVGGVLHDLGDLPGAREHFERALGIMQKAHGPEDPNVATAANNLGLVLQDLGDVTGAREHFARALAIDEKAYGPDHPNVATAANNLGRVLQGLGDLEGARARLERALAIFEKAYGLDHPNVATAVNNLGSVLKDLGDLEEARDHFARALAIDEKAYGPDHPEVATDVSNLGGVLHALGDLQGARRHFERALAIDEKAYGPEHPSVATDINNLGSVLQALGC